MMEFDLYEILGVERGADEREIKKAYRSLQKRCHPDIAGPSGHDMAIILNEIYALLSDPLSRSAYDLVGVICYVDHNTWWLTVEIVFIEQYYYLGG